MRKMLKHLQQICRICVEKYQSELTSIENTLIDYQSFQMPVKEVLRFFINEELLNSQEYPQCICTECIDLARNAFSFKILCDKSLVHLTQYFAKINEVTKENVLQNNEENVEEKYTVQEYIHDNDDDDNDKYEKIDYETDTSLKDEIYDNDQNCIEKKKNKSIRNRGRPKKKIIGSKGETGKQLKKIKSVEEKVYLKKEDNILENIYVCSICNKSFTNKYIYMAHKKRHELKGHFLCNICGKGFSSQGCLTRHNRMHTGEKNFECNVCLKRFPSSNNLNLHMRIHTGQKPYLCTVCGKKFSHPTGLTYHMRTHTKERPYSCDVCGKRFTIQCHLDRHKKIHSGERPFGCSKCSKAFIKKIDLQRHEAIHSGEKPFTCSVCEKKFLRKVHLNLHMMLHTAERPHQCSYCGKGFIRAYYLKDHINKHHILHDFANGDNDNEDNKPILILPLFPNEKSVDIIFTQDKKPPLPLPLPLPLVSDIALH